jgi:hypothetical protein
MLFNRIGASSDFTTAFGFRCSAGCSSMEQQASDFSAFIRAADLPCFNGSQ